MRTIAALAEILAGKCRNEMENAARRVKGVAVMLVSLWLAAVLLLAAIGLGIAAVFIAIASSLGGAVAAVICMGILLVSALIVASIGSWSAK